MSGQQNDDDSTDFSRRTFMKVSGVAAAAGVLGASASGTAAADHTIDSVFQNIRVREAQKAWRRGYRGRADRSLALTDSGADGRHADLGPWNGVSATTNSDDELVLERNVGTEETELPVFENTVRQTEEYSGQNAGAGALGFSETFGPAQIDTGEFETDDDSRVQLRGTVDWEPGTPEGTEEPGECELQILKNGTQVASTGGGLVVNTESTKTVVVEDPIELNAEDDYTFEVVTWRSVNTYTVTAEFEELVDTGETETREVTVTEDVSIDSDTLLPGKDDTPELVAWHNQDTSYGNFDAPRDANGHGTHVSGIMTGSGRGATVADSTTDSPNAILVAGDFLEYEVDAEAGTGVFGAATGDGVEVVIEGPEGRQLARSVGANSTSEISLEANITQTPTNHDSGTETYTVYVRTTEGEAVAPGRVEEVAVGAFESFEDTNGEANEDDDYAIHAGIAPGNSLVAISGLGGGTNNLARAAGDFTEAFNVRAVNMSWGAVGGVPFGILGGVVDTTPGDVESITDGGILTVAAAGNAATPANGNSSPAVVEEAISVVATGPRDGIASYSSGGVGGVDEDGTPHAKPDVTAPGGQLTQLDWASKAGDPNSDAEFGDVRDYTGKGGTSMASPSVCGTAGLVAQAMEEDAPDGISLPAPVDTDREDVMRLKQVLLATASTTAFTAAPYHRGKAPVYTHAERDPYEGFGRVNIDAAIDAVTRELLPGSDEGSTSASYEETVGLDVPEDSRAVGGYVTARGGTLDASISFSRYAGGNAGMAKGDPHIDLFVYDAETPAANGEPNVVASVEGIDGTGSVSVDVPTADAGADESTERTYYVVAKLVNVPGVVNGYDVQAYFDLELDFEAGEIPQETFTADGSRTVDSQVTPGGRANRVRLTVSDLDDDAVVYDRIPENWDLLESFGQGTETTRDGERVVEFREISTTELEEDGPVTFTYFVESPDAPEETNRYTFGPAIADIVDASEYANEAADFAGTDETVAVGASL
ncbi:S8 family serine peptidase [Natronomonas gomsonensis]|uniref:S8 family serine peptidase n=1 Tax=Natronomonas gomsonensis TaxID=1046043 RepID=UPI0015B870E1|nr:S8 family serine peptidase [Natronomonas gomsonensis]